MAELLLSKLRRRARVVKTETQPDDSLVEALCLRAEDGDVKGVADLVSRCGGGLSEKDCTGQTPLHVAVRSGKGEVVQLLLKAGARANATDSTGRTACDIVESIQDRLRRDGIKRLLSDSCLSPLSEGKGTLQKVPSCVMGDVGDVEAEFLHDFETSLHCTIDEAKTRYGVMADSHRRPQETHGYEAASGSETTGSDTGSCSDDLSSEKVGLVLVMVGLPGRGKTYIARRLCRWLNWKGTGCRIFNVGKYRRDLTRRASDQVASYFDPNNPDAAAEREKLAEVASTDLIRFLAAHPGCVAIFDATNSTVERRSKLVEQFTSRGLLPENRIIFIESVCTDMVVIHRNILRAKMGNEDYRGKEASYVIRDFTARISQYEKVYQPLSQEHDEARSWVQLRDTIGPRGGHIKINNISGHLPTKLLYFLFNLKTAVCPVYLVRCSKDAGFAASLRRFCNGLHEGESLRVWTSSDPTSDAAVRYFAENSRFLVRNYQSLRGIDRGDYRDLTDEEVQRKHPAFFKDLKSNAYSYSYPRGESYHEMNVRLEQIILDIHGSDIPILIAAEKEVCQGLYAYLAELLPEVCVFLDIPDNCVTEFAYKSHTVHVSMHDLNPWTDEANTMPAGEREAWAACSASEPPPQLSTIPHQALPAYMTSMHLSAVTVASSSDLQPGSLLGSPSTDAAFGTSPSSATTAPVAIAPPECPQRQESVSC